MKRWHPRLAISGCHLNVDPISGIVWETSSGYRVATKDLFKAPGKAAVSKVLFLYWRRVTPVKKAMSRLHSRRARI